MVTGVILLFCGGIGVSTNHFGTECLPESETDEMRYVLYLRVFIRSARVAIRWAAPYYNLSASIPVDIPLQFEKDICTPLQASVSYTNRWDLKLEIYLLLDFS